jgi:hypothetical protein
MRNDLLRRDRLGRSSPIQLFLAGTLSPALRASDSPMAIACFLLVTFLQLRPLFNFPCFIARISLSTLFPAAGEYLRVDFIPVVDFFFVALVAIASPCLLRWLLESLRLSRRRTEFEQCLVNRDTDGYGTEGTGQGLKPRCFLGFFRRG